MSLAWGLGTSRLLPTRMPSVQLESPSWRLDCFQLFQSRCFFLDYWPLVHLEAPKRSQFLLDWGFRLIWYNQLIWQAKGNSSTNFLSFSRTSESSLSIFNSNVSCFSPRFFILATCHIHKWPPLSGGKRQRTTYQFYFCTFYFLRTFQCWTSSF